jgi:hypothetical protein
MKACQTNYHHNFSVRNSVRTYYPGIPEYIQAGEHQYIETGLVNMWTTMMLVGW